MAYPSRQRRNTRCHVHASTIADAVHDTPSRARTQAHNSQSHPPTHSHGAHGSSARRRGGSLLVQRRGACSPLPPPLRAGVASARGRAADRDAPPPLGSRARCRSAPRAPGAPRCSARTAVSVMDGASCGRSSASRLTNDSAKPRLGYATGRRARTSVSACRCDSPRYAMRYARTTATERDMPTGGETARQGRERRRVIAGPARAGIGGALT